MARSTSKISAALLPALSNGTYPDDESILTAELNTNDIEQLLSDISAAKKALEDEVRAVSQQQSGDVDEWIAQARKAQEDIARCKTVAAEIVEEYREVQRLEDAGHDARSKVDLLRGELEFSASLQQELQTVASVKMDLDQIDSIMEDHPAKAATQLQILQASASQIRGTNASRILERRCDFVTRELHVKLETALLERIILGGTEGESWMEIVPDMGDLQPQQSSTEIILQALDSLGTLRRTTENISNKVESQILDPIVSLSSEIHVYSCSTADDRLTLSFIADMPTVDVVLASLEQVTAFLRSRLPAILTASLMQRILPKLVSALIPDWLTPSIPLELADIEQFHALQTQVENLAKAFQPFESAGSQQLLDWKQLSPRLWLTKRRMASLHAVRTALASKRGPTRSVERVETRTVSKQDAAFAVNGGTDDWDAGWDDEGATNPKKKDEDEDVSGWGFDDRDQDPEESAVLQDDAADAWGWDDENLQETKLPAPSRTSKPDPSPNGTGANANANGDRQITLAESYTITDIPDLILSVINHDVHDAEIVKSQAYTLLHSASSAPSLLQLPPSTLAMFRAIAPNHYTTTLPSGNMHLYNDVMYLIQSLPADTTDITKMTRFARMTYTNELSTHRTVLTDLLDGAQGFTNCTTQPYASQCETAIASTIAHLRSIHFSWQPILSHSALLQSIGSLVNHTVSKITTDILDMEDISASDSTGLVRFCNEITSLNDLFLSSDHNPDKGGGGEVVPMTAVYVPSWLRFQYLSNILESSLVDIKYLWTDSELRMEFSAEEVVDLIKALFQDSRQRRDAIAEIRA